MVFINIPYVASNDSIDKETVISAIRALDISEDAKHQAYEAIYNKTPTGVSFADEGMGESYQLERMLRRLGIPHRQSKI
ncbi:MAG: hypothetical protein LH614_15125 [Pyrinomonadaceae bacterium]|nr:hypothetical protein [Pyrinomonadaceae bacterium]